MSSKIFRAVCLALALALEAGAEPKDAPQPPPPVFQLRGLDLLHAFPTVRSVPVTFPVTEPVTSVEGIAAAGGKVWVLARPASMNTIPQGAGQLWIFSPAENQLSPLGDWFESHFPTAIHAWDRHLWITGGENVAEVGSLDIDKLSLKSYGPPLGITSPGHAGFAFASKSLFTLSTEGLLYRLNREGTAWKRIPNAAPGDSRGDPDHWTLFDGSGDWLIALHDQRAAVRHADGLEWTDLPGVLRPLPPPFEESKIHAVQGDGSGAFWVGTDAGLQRLLAETGSVEERLHTVPVSIRGGWNTPVKSGFQPSPAMQMEAEERITEQIRHVMLMRVKYARVSRESGRNVNPVQPTSRISGGVTALLIDKGFLWVATTDGVNANRGRVMVMHLGSHRWLGWFPVAAPVRCMAVDERLIWLGFDVHLPPARPPIMAVEKGPFLAIPATRWAPDTIDAKELDSLVAKLPSKEQLVYQFFAGNYQEVIKSVTAQLATASDEMIFLLACCYDPIGLDQPAKVDEMAALLAARFPRSVFTPLVENLRSRPAPAATTAAPAEPPPEMAAPAQPGAPIKFGPPPVAELLKKRDLNGDGKISPVEFKLWVRDQFEFKTFDTNGDGFLDAAELEKLVAELYGTSPADSK